MKSSKFSLILTALFITATAMADHVVVTFSTTEVVEKSAYGVDMQTSLADEQKKLAAPFMEVDAKIQRQKAGLEEEQKALAAEEEELKKQTQAKVVSQEALAEKYDALQRKRRDLQEKIADFERLMRKAHEDAKMVDQKFENFYRRKMMIFEQDIKAMIEEIATAEGWHVVLAKEGVIYASKSTDKTELIIKKLNEKKEKETTTKKAAAAVTKQ